MKIRKVAVTGGIACGKTTVCQIFRNLGARVVSADQIVHQLLSNDQHVKSSVIKLFGPEILENGSLNRDRIANLVFGNPAKLKALEAILHSRVLETIDQECKQAEIENATLFVAEIPLLFEIGVEKKYDWTIAVVASDEIAKKRDPRFTERMKAQMDINEKQKKADFVINNNGSLEELEHTCKELYPNLTKEKN